jgi:hypothetical protein
MDKCGHFDDDSDDRAATRSAWLHRDLPSLFKFVPERFMPQSAGVKETVALCRQTACMASPILHISHGTSSALTLYPLMEEEA